MTTNVTEQRAEYTEQLEDVERNRAAVAGERTVKKQGVKFLPPLASMCCTTSKCDDVSTINYTGSLTQEGQASYNKYISNAYFYGATGRTVDGLNGLIQSKEAVAELSSEIEYMIDNADSRGTTLRDFSSIATTEAMISPRSGVLVARPETPEGVSSLDVEMMNIRPKLIHYLFESIINWDYETIDNVERLSLVVLVEATTERSGFKVEVKKQYRVLELIDGVYHQSLYDDSGSLIEEVKPVIINGNTSDIIPFYFIEVGSDGKSIINDLVDANFYHYNISADYGAKLHYSSFIIYTESGAQSGENMIVGNGVKWSNPSHEAKFGILQPDGNSDSHRLALQDIEQRMAALGAEQLRPRTAMAESAEAKGLDQVAQNSTTANVAITVSNTITKALKFASEWMGGTDDVTYKLNTDYNPSGMSAQSLTALLATWQAGGISYETFYENLQRGEIASIERTADEEKSMTEVQDAGL